MIENQAEMSMEKTDIKSLSLEELKEYLKSMGEKPFRAGQIYQWMHEKLAAAYDEMTNLSKDLREKLKETTTFVSLQPVCVRISEIDGTRKYLFQLEDGNVIESVLMNYKHGNSVCISSPVGCRTGRSGAKAPTIGDAGSDLPDSAGYRRTGFQCGGDGVR